jgi:sulfoxide reductase heme-binding subunit YedZ
MDNPVHFLGASDHSITADPPDSAVDHPATHGRSLPSSMRSFISASTQRTRPSTWKIATEIVLRVYLTIGFVALLSLAALAATSADAMISRLGGRRWRRLHQLVYLIGILAIIHYCFQSKLDLWEPTIMAGLLFWLLGYRLLTRLVPVRGRLSTLWIVGLSLAAALVTAIGEAVYFNLAFGVAPIRVLKTDVSLATGMRPAAAVVVVGITLTAAGAIRAMLVRPTKRPGAA